MLFMIVSDFSFNWNLLVYMLESFANKFYNYTELRIFLWIPEIKKKCTEIQTAKPIYDHQVSPFTRRSRKISDRRPSSFDARWSTEPRSNFWTSVPEMFWKAPCSSTRILWMRDCYVKSFVQQSSTSCSADLQADWKRKCSLFDKLLKSEFFSFFWKHVH